MNAHSHIHTHTHKMTIVKQKKDDATVKTRKAIDQMTPFTMGEKIQLYVVTSLSCDLDNGTSLSCDLDNG